MFRKNMDLVTVTVLLLGMTWRPAANCPILLHFVFCAGAFMVVLALFFIKDEIEAHYDVDSGSNPARQVTVKLRAWRF
jgi:hypothetical protein